MSAVNPVSSDDEDFSINLSPEATKSKFVVDDGKYPARCVDLVKAKSKAGNEMYVFDFLGTGGEANGREYKARVLTAPEYQWKVVQILSAFGIKPIPRVDGEGNPVFNAKGEQEKDLPIKKSAIVGKKVTLDLKVQTFGDGKQSMSVESVLPREGGDDAASSDDIPF